MLRILIASITSGLLFPMKKSGESECFLIDLGNTGVKNLGSFEIFGGAKGAEVLLQTPKKQVIWSRVATASDKIELTEPVMGKHDLCFRTTVNHEQQFAFNLHYEDTGRKVITKSHTDKLQSLIEELESKVTEITDQQAYAISREENHRKTAENTNQRIIWWTLAEVGALVVLSIFQVYYLKSFFEVKIHV